jgi:hypothetical protein
MNISINEMSAINRAKGEMTRRAAPCSIPRGNPARSTEKMIIRIRTAETRIIINDFVTPVISLRIIIIPNEFILL